MRMIRAAVPLFTLSLVLAACSSGTGATPAASVQAPTPAASEAAPSAAAGAVTVNLVDTPLGKVLADGTGKTLYVFTVDTAGKSNCSGDCLANWPALASDAVPTLGEGLDAEDFSTISRDTAPSRSPSTGCRCTTSPATRPRTRPTARASAASGSWSMPRAR